MTVAGFFWRYFRRYIAWMVVALLAVFVYAASTATVVVLVEPILSEVLLTSEAGPVGRSLGPGGDQSADQVTDQVPGPLKGWAEQLDLKDRLQDAYRSLKRRFDIGPNEVIYFVPLLFVLVFIVRNLADFLSGYSFQCVGLGSTTEIRNDLYDHVLRQSSRFHTEHSSGELVSRVVSDIGVMQQAVSTHLLDLVQQSVTLVVLLLLLLSVHLKLALICLLAAPVVVYPIVRFGSGLRRTTHRRQERLAELTSLLAEGVRGHRVVKAFGSERFEHRRFCEASRRHLRANLWAQMLIHAAGPVVVSLAVIGMGTFLVYAAKSIRSGGLTPATLLMFLTNIVMMYDPIRKLNKVNLTLQQVVAVAERVRGMMATDNEIKERPGAVPLPGVEHGVAFRGVSFAYADRPVLRDVTLEIPRGRIIALVGPSGAGKSTLVSLLPRFFDPDSGCVTIDGRDTRDLPLENLRSLIGIVTQETVLFNDTVRNNIGYAQTDPPLERVREAAMAAYADDFIMEMPDGYETLIGESGVRLSGGQRQRLAIARALYKNAPILILDEATSHLDSESEVLVQKALYNLMQDRTTLVIAHRLSTVTRADRIVVMENGRIVEEGTHNQLISSTGKYRQLHDLQFQSGSVTAD